MEKKVFAKKLGKRIAAKRKEKKMTQVQLAFLLGLPKQNIYRVESGAVTPSSHFVHLIALALKVRAGELMEV